MSFTPNAKLESDRPGLVGTGLTNRIKDHINSLRFLEGGGPSNSPFPTHAIRALITRETQATGIYYAKTNKDDLPLIYRDTNAITTEGNLTEEDLGPWNEDENCLVYFLSDVQAQRFTIGQFPFPVEGFLMGSHENTTIPILVSGSGVAELLGEYQHMARQMVTQNEVGYDFVMAHSLI